MLRGMQTQSGIRGPSDTKLGTFVAVVATLALGTMSCSGPSPIEAGDQLTLDGDESTARQVSAVLEPANTLIDDPGPGWAEVGRWYTEGSMTQWGTGCSGFDILGDIFNHGTPQTVVWERDGDYLFQRTDDFGWDAGGFADAVAQVPTKCPSVDVGSTTVSVRAVDPSLISSTAERVTSGDPNGRLEAIALDAYPHPSAQTDIATPEFEAGRPTWMVIATRHNVVSQLVYSPAPGSGSGSLADLVIAQVDALLDAPTEATMPISRSAPPASVARG